MALKDKVPADLVGGDVEEGYGKVADAFRRNLCSGREIGAAVAVYREGRKVVDLWGGYRNGITQSPWEHDTVVIVFSTTKGVAALAVALAVSRGYLSYDALVADYWPEFAQSGKDSVTVRQLLSYQAGLAVIDAPLTLGDFTDPEKITAILAAQAPAWPPGTRQGYHPWGLGPYLSELIRRTDPGGRTLGRFFAEEIAAPLKLDFYIGLPASLDRDRVAHLHGWSATRMLFHLHTLPPRFAIAMTNPRSLTARASMPPGVKRFDDFNREEVRVVEMPAGNGHGTARSIAQLYGDAATGGSKIGLSSGSLHALQQPPVPPTGGLRDRLLHVDTSWSLGFLKPAPISVFGSTDHAFGTAGAGGSFGFADPETGTGFAYVTNKVGFHLISDPRELALRQALFRDVIGSRTQT
ncbi:serine hydrolase domain-containing protein [Mycobacterium sp. 1164985.4]|uniref:serine hydrolase domain-containing protein n=1 Tax=Mycobacterium sp. 1164985.4 TaxID=1834069 RepID=UPI000801CEE3|nr:serine hydrolase domain-containing protein [Mycobacterium sp. 1164985.4]OBK73540.1 EstA family serine hydrolase [Mycobacterium sp. 1164985.4]